MNLQKMMKQAQQMQAKMEQMQAKMEEVETEGSAGGGAVTVLLSGKGVMKKLTIDESLIDPEEKEVLEDLIIAAHNDAKTKSESTFQEEMSKMTEGMGLPPGMKLPF